MFRVFFAIAMLTLTLSANAAEQSVPATLKDDLMSSEKFTSLFIPTDYIVDITPVQENVYAVEMFYYRCTYLVRVVPALDFKNGTSWLQVEEIEATGCDR